jgi:hypothetical protein
MEFSLTVSVHDTERPHYNFPVYVKVKLSLYLTNKVLVM